MKKIAIIGLGYVGLPLAVEFGKHFKTIGFDINSRRIQELQNFEDKTLEVASSDLKDVEQLTFSCSQEDLKGYDFYIITVPTPVDEHNHPCLLPLKKASELVGSFLGKGSVVVYESTVFPGCTEEVCIPILENVSNLKYNKDFFCGYSPERINPGDKKHNLTNIVKITSGSTPEAATAIDELYSTIIQAGTYKASSIKIAEASKVIENSQRDLNIAFVNELAKIFNRLGIDTNEVLDAASTKWNFLPFRPGLVGGHCIGVDPYYLAYKSLEVGYHPEIILAGRRINNDMGHYVAEEVVKLLIRKKTVINEAYVLVLGITFKENCPDIRNSKVPSLIKSLESYGCNVDVHDPWADINEVRDEYSLELLKESEMLLKHHPYKAVIIAVNHAQFKKLNLTHLDQDAVLYDVKNCLPQECVDGRL